MSIVSREALEGPSHRRQVRVCLVMQGAFPLALRVLSIPRLLWAWLPPTCMFTWRCRAICLWVPLSAVVLAWQLVASARAEGIACSSGRAVYG